MKKYINKLQAVLVLCMLFLMSVCCHAEAPLPSQPVENIYVSDNAGIIDADTESQIGKIGTDLNKRFGAQLVVVTVDSLHGDDIESYSNRLFRTWGIGSKDKNNGVLLMIAKKDRKFRIEVGYGLEGAITDGYAGTVLDDMKPYFRDEEYSEGIMEAYGKLAAKTYAEYGVDVPEEFTAVVQLAGKGLGNEIPSGDEEYEWWTYLIGVPVALALFALLLYCMWQMVALVLWLLGFMLSLLGITFVSRIAESMLGGFGVFEILGGIGGSSGGSSYSGGSSSSGGSSGGGGYGGGSSGGGGASGGW